MASETDQCPRPLPTYLRSLHPGIYEDQVGRTWVTVAVRLSPSQRAQSRDPRVITREHSIMIYLWQMSVHSQKAMSLSQSYSFCLPPMWELCPERRYQATDSRLWEIVDHGQVDVAEQLILMWRPQGD